MYNTLQRAVQYTKKGEQLVERKEEMIIFTQPLKVLLVDDNPVNMALNERIMSLLTPNAELLEAVDGKLALDACKEKQFDLILMDVQMPIMDGIEATKNIRLLPNYAQVPIIGVTAGNILGEKEKCLNAGMSDFLTKPLRQDELFEMLKKYIEVSSEEKNEENLITEDYLNMDMLKSQIGEDEDSKTFFLNLVLQELKQSEEKCKKLLESRDLEMAKAFLHKLRGTSATSGLYKLSELSLKWEKSVDKNTDYQKMIPELLNEIGIGEKIISQFLKK